MLNKIINKLKVFLARRRLECAIAHTEQMRRGYVHLLVAVVPKLEDELERAELAVLTDEFYKDAGL